LIFIYLELIGMDREKWGVQTRMLADNCHFRGGASFCQVFFWSHFSLGSNSYYD